MKRNQTVPNLLQSVFGFLFFVVVLVLVVPAQTQSPERGFNPGKSYSMSDIETISMQSGNLMLNIPLGSLPSGRGGMSASLGLNYNSKLYDILTQSFAEEDPQFLDSLKKSSDGGWRYNYKYSLDLEHKPGGWCVNQENDTLFHEKLSIILPDGSKHTLNLKDRTQPNGYMELYPDGRRAC